MSAAARPTGYLDRLVDAGRDHTLGPPDAPINLVEYGSYACPHCRAANERVTEVRAEFGDRLCYAFRQLPLPDNDLAFRAAQLAESAVDPEEFWKAHVILMSRSESLTEEDLQAAEAVLTTGRLDARASAARVREDEASAFASGVWYTPTFFINRRRYDGPWDETSFTDAMLGSLGHRVRTAALRFASWAPSTGTLLIVATVLAIVIANTSLAPAFQAFWHTPAGVAIGGAAFRMPFLDLVNDGLLTVFFLVVGLEIKREFTIGSLSSRRTAALPVAAAIGGMAVPALIYTLLVTSGAWSRGWGVPMATDTAFAIALIAIMGRRVPVELRVFLTAAAIVDDIGAIIVVAFVYSAGQHWAWLGGAAGIVLLLWLLNRSSVYRITPYLLLGVALWMCVHAGGLHATLSGIILAAFIPTRPPPDYRALIIQADTILKAEARHEGEELRYGPSEPALRALDDIHDRLESPADRMLRTAGPRSSYVILPLFALANAGVTMAGDVFQGHGTLILAITVALVVGKPLGFLAASALAVRTGLAEKPGAYSWRQLAGAGALAGIGFTMSLFIAGQAFPREPDFAAAKLAVFGAALLAAAAGLGILWAAPTPAGQRLDPGDRQCPVGATEVAPQYSMPISSG